MIKIYIDIEILEEMDLVAVAAVSVQDEHHHQRIYMYLLPV